MPWAPARIEEAIAFFIARRNETRCSSCLAMCSATSWASRSARLISSMLSCTCFLVSCFISSDSLSTCSPLRPITSPGRAVLIPIVTLSPLRSIVIFEIPAWNSRFLRYRLISRSSFSSAAKLRVENQRESQVFTIPRRRPIGCVFCPMRSLLLRGHGHRHVAGALEDRGRSPLRSRQPALERRPGSHDRLLHVQLLEAHLALVQRVRHPRLQHLLDDARPELRRELEGALCLL